MVRYFVPVFHSELDGSSQIVFLRTFFGFSLGSDWVFLRIGWFFQDLIGLSKDLGCLLRIWMVWIIGF